MRETGAESSGDRASSEPGAGAPARTTGRWRRVARRAWWLHSGWALLFGVGVMLFARRGLDYAETVLAILAGSWFLVFIAFRFIVGAHNRRPDERLARRGLRILTNYVIKQLYQQMFFFLVPLYAASATWSLASPNWWLVPVLLLFAVVSTLDLIFDNVVMEHRILASTMYGFCMFGVLNLILPLTVQTTHFQSLLIAAAAAPVAVALLTFPMGQVFSWRGLIYIATAILAVEAAVFVGRRAIPPAPTTTWAMAVGHGRPGEFECVPGPAERIRSDRLEGLRCVTKLSGAAQFDEPLVHVWQHRGVEVARVEPALMDEEQCGELVYRSTLGKLPEEPLGKWTCSVETGDGQLLGLRRFEITPAR